MTDQPSRRSKPDGFTIALILVGVFTIGCAWLFRSSIAPPPSRQLSQPFPPIEAAGWINGPAPTELRNDVFVVDAWAYWCGPCRAAMPDLIKLHEKYKDRGVTFLGLTSEGTDPDSLKQTEQAVKTMKIPWPNGFGVLKTLSALEVDAIPQLWVVNRQGNIVYHERGWSDRAPHEIDAAIEKALDAPPDEPKAGK